MEKVRKIGIDARFFGPKDKGFGRYVQNLLLNLEKTDKENLYFVFLNRKRADEYVPQNLNFQKILIGHNSLWPFKITKKINGKNLDIMHFTCLPFPILYRNKAKVVFTVHDLTWKNFPPFKNFLKRIFYNLAFSRAIRKSQAIIANSQYVKKDILKTYKINPEKIKVVYEGIN